MIIEYLDQFSPKMKDGRSIVLFVSCWVGVAMCHIPMRSEDWAEPDIPIHSVDFARSVITKQQSLDRLTALRDAMKKHDIQAYIIPTADAHGSQYIAPSDARREWISGFTGSAGTAVVTMTEALLWTDARYYLQFDMEVDTGLWQLMKSGDISIPNWLVQNTGNLDIVGLDPTTYTRAEWNNLVNILTEGSRKVEEITTNLVDEARTNFGDPPPARPNNPLLPLGLEYTGKSAKSKISELMKEMESRSVTALVLSALDDIAYTLNLRGTDIPYNPVFFSYLIIRNDVAAPANIVLFWGSGTLATNVTQHLADEGVALETRPYEEVFQYLRDFSQTSTSGRIWLTQTASHALNNAAEPGRTPLVTLSPVALMKCVKNDVERKGFRSAHIKDGIAVVRFLRWVHQQVDEGYNVTEVQASDKLEEFRSEEAEFMGPSFATIAGTGANGAVIHYKPNTDGEQFVIHKEHMLLVDSGGQYRDGTTDITRTRHMNYSPTEKQRLAFTRVMKGQISLGTAVFPKGILGNVLETLARKSLWDVGLNYAHGTGHGVGHYLNVHEGPSGIMSAAMAGDPGLAEGMVYSNEPGYYEEGEFGIRHEDLIEVIPLTKDTDHIQAADLVGDFSGVGALGFSTLSLAPHQTACLDVELLTDFEIKYINAYHARVLDTLGPILLNRNLTEDHEWLEKECAPIGRNAAILIQLTPVLAGISIVISKLF